jgi:hypothetical protein
MTANFTLKSIIYNEKSLKIIMQNDNGPCPVIALANCLLLLGHLQLPPSTERISFNELVEMIGNYLLTIEGNEEHHQNLGDVLALLPTLDKGLDVNIHFTRADAFEFTAAISMFDCCKILIFHGWVIPPDDSQNYGLIAKKLKSYNGLADCIIRGEALNTHDEVYDELMCQVAVCKEFISEHSTQLTFAGLDSLKQLLPEDRPSVLFRNNHFLTILKRDGKLYTMVTDQGYTSSPIVWESLDSITGSSTHYDTNFQHLDPELPTYRQSLSDIKVPATFQEIGSSNDHLDPE